MIDDAPFCGNGLRPGPHHIDISSFSWGMSNPSLVQPGLGGINAPGAVFPRKAG